MKSLKIKFGLFSLLAVLSVSVFLTSCEQEQIDEQLINEALITNYQEGDERLGEFIVEEGDGFVLTETNPEVLGIAPALLDELIKGFNEMNEAVKRGEILKEQINTTVSLEDAAIDSRCGSTKVKFHWTSVTIYLSRNAHALVVSGGCDAIGVLNSVAGVVCDVLAWAAGYYSGCSCGYKYNISYWGTLKSVYCQ